MATVFSCRLQARVRMEYTTGSVGHIGQVRLARTFRVMHIVFALHGMSVLCGLPIVFMAFLSELCVPCLRTNIKVLAYYKTKMLKEL